MEFLPGIIAIIMIFGFIPLTLVFRSYLKLLHMREERRQLGPGDSQERAQLDAVVKENIQLRARVDNLETIVLSSETGLNQRLERLLRENQNSVSRIAQLEGISFSRQLTGLTEPLPDLGPRYRIVEEIGRGGFGTVYRAQDLKLSETVALKVLPPHVTADPKAAERFAHEASAARRITHPNVIRIHDLGEEKGRLYISMEYFPSVSLKQLVRRDGPLPLGRGLNVGRQIIDGLAAAHLQGVVHRDLKPQNVLVGKADLCKLIDFGLAKSNLMLGLTASGTIMGTPEYMSPEQVRGQSVAEPADLYSLGVVLYEMFSGDVPFHGDNPVAVGYLHLHQAPPPIETKVNALPPALCALVMRLLEKRPEDRYVSAKDVAAAWTELER
jgi:serine/threonine protein kinase